MLLFAPLTDPLGLHVLLAICPPGLRVWRRGLLALPLYSGLPPDQQLRAFEPAPSRTRKCVVATNIAEASVTVLGVAYVIDCGFAKCRLFDPALGRLSRAKGNAQRTQRVYRFRTRRNWKMTIVSQGCPRLLVSRTLSWKG